VDFCEHSDEPSGSIREDEIISKEALHRKPINKFREQVVGIPAFYSVDQVIKTQSDNWISLFRAFVVFLRQILEYHPFPTEY
jgi:hypothetical protein